MAYNEDNPALQPHNCDEAALYIPQTDEAQVISAEDLKKEQARLERNRRARERRAEKRREQEAIESEMRKRQEQAQERERQERQRLERERERLERALREATLQRERERKEREAMERRERERLTEERRRQQEHRRAVAAHEAEQRRLRTQCVRENRRVIIAVWVFYILFFAVGYWLLPKFDLSPEAQTTMRILIPVNAAVTLLSSFILSHPDHEWDADGWLILLFLGALGLGITWVCYCVNAIVSSPPWGILLVFLALLTNAISFFLALGRQTHQVTQPPVYAQMSPDELLNEVFRDDEL